ncbi:MAG: HEAT repeat domain-containing protein [bacterium]
MPKTLSRPVFFVLLATLTGILGGLFLGTWLVAESNGQLLAEQEIIARLGYIAVPGKSLFPEMRACSTCLAGGLFFALSLGCGYGCLCGFVLWISSFYQKRGYQYVRLGLLILLAAAPVADLLLGKGGPDPAVLLFFLLVPLVLWCAAFRLLPPQSFHLRELCGYGILLVMFALFLGAVLLNTSLIDPESYDPDFIEIRDRLLLPTKIGQKINEFYYRYTLYPARMIKPLHSRLQNVAALDSRNFPGNQLSNIQAVLRRCDWFPVVTDPRNTLPAETTLTSDTASEEVLFYWQRGWPKRKGKRGEPVYRVSYQDFIRDPYRHLKNYSERIYSFELLRMSCGLSLFLVVPLALVLALFWCLLVLIRLFFRLSRISPNGTREAVVFSAVMLFGFGLSIWHGQGSPGQGFLWKRAPVLSDKPGPWWEIVRGNAPGDRLLALHRLNDILPPDSGPDFHEEIIFLTRDRDPVFRRFGAEFLGKLAFRNADEIIPVLISLLKDPNLNVAYTAAGSLGRFRNRQARDVLLEILKSDRAWYLKMKVYSALKSGGWHQQAASLSLFQQPFPFSS